MLAEIVHPKEDEEFLTPEGCSILELYNRRKDPHVSVARASVPSGVTTQAHSLTDVTERYLIISGSGRVSVEGLASSLVGPGDLVVIPPEAVQRIENIGSGDLIFYCICTPRFTQKSYRDRTDD